MNNLTKAVVAISASLFVLSSVAKADVLDPGSNFVKVDKAGTYVYKQGFMPKETVEIDLSKTAMFVTDPQNDFLSEGSPAWPPAVQGIRVERIESDYEGDLDARGFFGISEDVNKGYQKIRANMRVKSDADVKTLTKLAVFSPVFEMLSASVPVEFSLVKI